MSRQAMKLRHKRRRSSTAGHKRRYRSQRLRASTWAITYEQQRASLPRVGPAPIASRAMRPYREPALERIRPDVHETINLALAASQALCSLRDLAIEDERWGPTLDDATFGLWDLHKSAAKLVDRLDHIPRERRSI